MDSTKKKDFDEILKGIAKELHLESDIDNLGKALGFSPADIGRYCDANEKQGGNYMGTLGMLRAWQKGQNPAEQRNTLRAALEKAGLKQMAYNHLGTPAQGEQSLETSSSLDPGAAANMSGAGSNRREVTDEEITKLCENFPHGKYAKFFEALGFDYNYHQQILKKHQGDINAAIKEVLQEWKTKTGGYMDDLDAALKKADLGGLISKYKN